jgi:pilus assembly protein TadC
VVGAVALLGGASGGASGLVAGAVLGCVVALAADAGARHAERRAARRRRDERAAALPAMLDLVASCLRAGTPFVGALEIVAAALPGPLADDLSVVAALHRLGATTSAAWADWVDDDVLGPVARAVAASAESGSRLADALERLAADARDEATLVGEAKARRAGVVAMAPLGLCFLPAFACLGVAPVVLGIAAEVVGWQ